MQRPIPWYSVFLHIVVIALAAEVLYLVQQNRELRSRPPTAQRPSIEVGDAVEPIAAADLDGNPRTVAAVPAQRETVLLLFTTTCPFCVENQSAWKDLYARYGDRYDVVGVSIDSPEATRNYVAEHQLPYPVVVPDDPKTFPREYRIPGVPQTLVVDREGRVRHTWPGVLSDENLERL